MDVFVFFLCMADEVLAIGLTVYMIVCLSDLQFDFVSTDHGCKKLNKCVRLEIIISSIVPLLLFLSAHWILCLLTCPPSIFLVYRSHIGVYDPAIIRNGNQLVDFQKESFVKIGYHLVVFFICLYYFIVYLIT